MSLPKWMHNGQEVTNISDPAIHGFVYEIQFADGTKYVGKKKIHSVTTKPALKNNKKRAGHIRFLKKRKNRKLVQFEEISNQSNWLSYIGSFDKNEFEDNTVVSRTIISFHPTKKSLSFAETELLFKQDVLKKDEYRNSNIDGKYFKKDIMEIQYEG
jgi:hypothetical protein